MMFSYRTHALATLALRLIRRETFYGLSLNARRYWRLRGYIVKEFGG